MFERFTDQCINAIRLAQEEVRRLGFNAVDTEHVLLGLLGGKDRDVARACLVSRGISLKAARLELEKITGRGPGFVSTEMPITAGTKNVFNLAGESARIRGTQIGTEDLLLGLLATGRSNATEVLKALGLRDRDLEEMRDELLAGDVQVSNQEPIDKGYAAGTNPSVNSPTFESFSISAIDAVMIAQEYAKSVRLHEIDASELLYGLLVEGESPAAKLLRSCGLTVERYLSSMKVRLAEHPALSVSDIPFAPRSLRVFFHARIVAEKHGSKSVEPMHLLFALVNWTDNIPVKLLEAGVDILTVKRHLFEEIRVAADSIISKEQLNRDSESIRMLSNGGTTQDVESAQENPPKALKDWFSTNAISLIARTEVRARKGNFSYVTAELLFSELLGSADWVPLDLEIAIRNEIHRQSKNNKKPESGSKEIEFSQDVLKIFMDARKCLVKEKLDGQPQKGITEAQLLYAIFRLMEEQKLKLFHESGDTELSNEVAKSLKDYFEKHDGRISGLLRDKIEPLQTGDGKIRLTSRLLNILKDLKERRKNNSQSNVMGQLLLLLIDEACSSETAFVQNRLAAIESVKTSMLSDKNSNVDIVQNGALKRVLEAAANHAKRLQSQRLDINHLALGLLEEDNSELDSLLVAFEGKSGKRVRNIVKRRLDQCLLSQIGRGYQAEPGELFDIEKVNEWMESQTSADSVLPLSRQVMELLNAAQEIAREKGEAVLDFSSLSAAFDQFRTKKRDKDT